MTRRYLVGPVSRRFADDHLVTARPDGHVLTFGPAGADVTLAPGQSWADLLAHLPAGWAPDVLLLCPAYTLLPEGFAAATIPVVAYAPDWPLHWHGYRALAPFVDRLWSDVRGTERLVAGGVGHARAVVPFGRPAGPPGTGGKGLRDIDVLWVGNFQPAIHRDRLHWVGRLAALTERYRVRIEPGLDPAVVRPLLARSRVAFLPSFHGAWDGLVAEALAAGAVVARDADVPEVPNLRPGQGFVRFAEGDLEATIDRLLRDEPHRTAVAAAGLARAGRTTTEARWAEAVAAVEADWAGLQAAAARRVRDGRMPGWELRHVQGLSRHGGDAPSGAGPTGPGERLAAAVRALGRPRPNAVVSVPAVEALRRLEADPAVGWLAGLHLAEWLVNAGRPGEAVARARRVQEAVTGAGDLGPAALGPLPLRPGFDAFRVEWERAGWQHAGDPAAEARAKRDLLRARCELLLGRADDDPARVVRSARIVPAYSPATQAAAAAAARIGAVDDAAALFERALAGDPFRADLVQGFADLLHRRGDAAGLDRLRRDRARIDATRLAGASGPPVAARRPRVSLTMIVRDEEANLAACLDSARDLVDEVVVVDTGSTDRTPELAAARGARVVRFPWRDDFAAARNAGVDAARGDWIFWLDADERLDAANRERVRRLFAGLGDENAAYLMRQLSPSEDAVGATTAVDQVRLFRNRPDVRWEYRIHEQILLSIRRTRADVRATNIIIDHHGYRQAGLRDRKLERNTRLLELAYRERPGDPVLAFNLALVYHKSDRAAAALPLLELCRRALAPQVSIVPKVYRLLGQVLARLGRTTEALAAYADGRRRYPDDVELLLHHGLLLQRVRDYAAAEACFRRALAVPPASYPVGLDLGLKGYKTRNALADLFLEQGRLGEAEDAWRAVLAEQPGFGPGHVGLAAVALARGRPGEAETILDRLTPTDPDTRAGVERLRRRLRTPAAALSTPPTT